MTNSMQLKAIIRNISKEKKISAQLVLQNYMLERFLERVSLSRYRNSFIIKGGFLIASIVGLDSRATMDMDATVKGYPLNDETVQKMILEIINVFVDDGISFDFRSIAEIREGDEYTGYRIALTANCEKMAVPLKLDITTGDKITPKEIEYEYKLMFENRSIRVLAYNLPTILAEKLETVISRGDQNTRSRDYYDIYTLTKAQSGNINTDLLRAAFKATTEKRGSVEVVKRYREIIRVVRYSSVMNRQWNDYRKEFDYAGEIDFGDTCDAVVAVMDAITLKTVFESENIRFVEVSGSLVDDYLVMINDVENVQKYIRREYTSREPYTREQEIEWVNEQIRKKALVFSMIEKKTGSFIGNISLMDPSDSSAELGIAVTAAKQDSGYASEAIPAVMGYGFDALGLKKITLKVNPENARAIHVYEKCGFREYDRTYEHIFIEAYNTFPDNKS